MRRPIDNALFQSDLMFVKKIRVYVRKSDGHKKVVLVTSSQPSLNPRLVKEADALSNDGFHVVVIGQFWNEWAYHADKVLLKTKRWEFHEVGGNPITSKLSYYITRAFHSLYKRIIKSVGVFPGLAELTIGRCTIPLVLKVLLEKPDFCIGHNPGGLPVAAIASKILGIRYGFDAEDFHRHEYSDDPNHVDSRTKKYLEERYFPRASYLTTASPLISLEYAKHFPDIKFKTILNVCESYSQSTSCFKDGNIRLFWFSQTIGHNRGIAEIINALGILNLNNIELHLLGYPRTENIVYFKSLWNSLQLPENQLVIHEPIPANTLISFASQFDIGMASEPGFNFNNKIALSNKLFTYLSAGLAILSSNTPAQQEFMDENPQCGLTYVATSQNDLANKIRHYVSNVSNLEKVKNDSLDLAKTKYNWTIESNKFLEIVKFHF